MFFKRERPETDDFANQIYILLFMKEKPLQKYS